MRIALTVTTGPHRGQIFEFTDHELFVVGRSRRAHLRLPAQDDERGYSVSRLHFMVEVNPPRCRVIDLGSRNGTYVNGVAVKAAVVQDGDEIRAGVTALQVRVYPETSLPPPGETSTLVTPEISAVPPTQAPTENWDNATAGREDRTAAGPVSSNTLLSPTVPDPESTELRPTAIGQYRILRELGRGGMGVVYLAEDPEGERVALKTIIPAVAAERVHVERFLREAEVLRQLDHPFIVGFRAMGEADGRFYFVMDYVPGYNAAELVQRHGPLNIRLAARMLCQVLQALEYAHAKGFVHRDVKPANLLVSQEDGRRMIKLADFGLARVYQASRLSGLTVQGSVAGTAQYMPPEQVLRFREVKPLGDQYSAAATLYHLLTANVPFEPCEDNAELLRRVLEDDPVPIRSRRPDIPEELAAVIHRALARQPENRFRDVRRMRRALLPFAQ